MRRIAALLVIILSAPAGGQELEEVERLALSGQTGEARTLLSAWWDSEFRDATRVDRQRGLWLRGLLTVDLEMAELDFQRLVVEYPGGRYSAEALVRLGGAAEARGETDEAARYFSALLRDYPASRFRTLARAWLESRVGTVDVEPTPANAIARRRSTRPPGAAGDDGSAATRTPSRSGHAVQLGAFSSERRARDYARAAGDAGFDVRVVRLEGNELFRVRVGSFDTKDEAEAVRRTVAEAGFDATVVSDVEREVSSA